ncbi:hypothetical protein V6N12_040273 [Hibiscus sabdariffa]|uniref:peroxidase n=1 Tax=Hibiscus sabdariffa TaxID=183260 RepID=A0ABR2E369_9ROSI
MNFGIRKLETIHHIKYKMEAECRYQLHCLEDPIFRSLSEEGIPSLLIAKQLMSSHVRRWTLHKHSGHVLMGKGLFTIDSRMSIDQRTAPIVAEFAANKYRFFQIFSSAFVKLSLSNVLTNDEGEVGRKCNQVN